MARKKRDRTQPPIKVMGRFKLIQEYPTHVLILFERYKKRVLIKKSVIVDDRFIEGSELPLSGNHLLVTPFYYNRHLCRELGISHL